MKILQTKDNTGDTEPGLIFLEPSSITNVVSHVTSVAVVHDQEKFLSGLKGTNHVHQERMV